MGVKLMLAKKQYYNVIALFWPLNIVSGIVFRYFRM